MNDDSVQQVKQESMVEDIMVRIHKTNDRAKNVLFMVREKKIQYLGEPPQEVAKTEPPFISSQVDMKEHLSEINEILMEIEDYIIVV